MRSIIMPRNMIRSTSHKPLLGAQQNVLYMPLSSFHFLCLLGDTGFPPNLRPLYIFRPIDIDSGSPNPVQTYPLLNKPVTTQRPFGLIIILFYFSCDFLIISPLYYLLFPLSPYLGL